MIYGFYFWFYKKTHLKGASIVLAYLTRFLFFICFQVKRVLLKRKNVRMKLDEALQLLESTSPDPNCAPSYSMTERDPEVDLSIIVPVYNHLDVLPACIESVLNQKTQYNYEVLLVDDGSTDGAQNLIERYRENSRVKIVHQKNAGIAAARNTGISLAGGQYLMFVDCDDTVRDNLVESLLRPAKEHNLDIVMGAHDLVKKTEGQIRDKIPNIYPQRNMLGYKNGDAIMNYAGLPWGKVYKRELFDRVRFFPGYWYEDTIVQSLLFTQCRMFRYIPKVVYEYYWHESNFSHTQGGKNQPKAVDRYWLLKAIAQQYEKLELPFDAKFYTMLLKHVSMYYYGTIATLSDDIIEAMFVAGRELLLKYKPKEKVKLPYMLRLTEKAILENDIELWKLCSINQ